MSSASAVTAHAERFVAGAPLEGSFLSESCELAHTHEHMLPVLPTCLLHRGRLPTLKIRRLRVIRAHRLDFLALSVSAPALLFCMAGNHAQSRVLLSRAACSHDVRPSCHHRIHGDCAQEDELRFARGKARFCRRWQHQGALSRSACNRRHLQPVLGAPGPRTGDV